MASKSAYVSRHVEASVKTALADSRIVAIVGPRQSGKSTLARRIASSDGRKFVTLDDVHVRKFALADPHGFVRENQFAVIDEIQLAPDLFFALKKDVDENPDPGRWLITGSVDLFKKAVAPDSLAGRVSTIELLPFSQAEIDGCAPASFLRRAFAADFPAFLPVGRTANLIDRILTGGYPLAVGKNNLRSRQVWLRDYADSLAEHDLPGFTNGKGSALLPRLLGHAAAAAGSIVNLSSLAGHLAVDHKSVDRWLTLLERMFLLRRIAPWSGNRIKRLSKRPKLHFLDSGLAAALRSVTDQTIERNRAEIGLLLECFVLAEISKALVHHDQPLYLSHYRDAGGAEVDFVLEDPAGMTVGIEVKAAAGVSPRDLRGLQGLAAATADRFACGIVLHDGDRIDRLAERIFALPVAMLWID
ncbi:MAG: ATP-binding protein [Betaproteobacteria bacterium]|nr:ATP-binding protein [Betaproteobacteria bacterium]